MNVPESGTFFLHMDGRQTDLAVTKLMHMKEAPTVPHRHLANAVKYILDEKITKQKRVTAYMSAAMRDMTVKIS